LIAYSVLETHNPSVVGSSPTRPTTCTNAGTQVEVVVVGVGDRVGGEHRPAQRGQQGAQGVWSSR